MSFLSLKVLDRSDRTICVGNGENFTDLVCTREYQEGDRIVLETSEKNIDIVLQLDDAMGPVLLYLKDHLSYQIPFGEKRICHSPKLFYGSCHYLYARTAREDEVRAYRNLAFNPADQHENKGYFPHAFANVETRGESVFAAKNAIDGVYANNSHGGWPYQSWGINQRKDAEMTIDFGRTVFTDRIVLYTRADFPHDSFWTKVTLTFSDDSSIDWELEKTGGPQVLTFEKKIIEWVKLGRLIKAEDDSPFPALTQIEVYGGAG